MDADPPSPGRAGPEAIAEQERGSFPIESWLEALRVVAGHYRLPLSSQSVKLAGLWDQTTEDRDKIRTMAHRIGLRVGFSTAAGYQPSSWHLPVIVETRSRDVAVVTAIGEDDEAIVQFCGSESVYSRVKLAELLADARLIVLPRPAKQIPDSRVDTYIRPYEEHWLRRILTRDLPSYGNVLIASVITNLLTLAGILFSMQVYDRVIPAQSFPTLYILFGGVLIAVGFDFFLRKMRMNIIDLLGKRADRQMSDQVFGHALRVRNRARPASTGTFIAQLRDLEQVREMLTSTTVSALADIPFFLLFLVIFWYIGGILVLVPMAALVLLVVPSLAVQRRLRGLASEAMRESSLRNAMLVEAVQRVEDIKSLQAEDRFQQQWNHYNAVAGDAQLKLRGLTNSLTAWTQNIQSAVYATVVFCGAPLVMSGDMTTGALVGASILGSRMMAPLAQVTQVLSRIQHAKIGIKSLDQIMQLPVDHPDKESRIHLPSVEGKYALRSAMFQYGDATSPPALTVKSLDIAPGEKIALLGKNGAGKSTLLQALSGLLEPASGELLLDGMNLQHVDPADIRRDVGLLSQDSRLFHGTIRDNLLIGAPQASEEEMQNVLSMVGADEFIRKSRRGLEHPVLEGGIGLSGGQAQALLLARLLIRQPSVVLLDEPTAAMDEATERNFIQRFKTWSRNRTVVIATHRMRVLDLADRLVVIDAGTIVLDDGKESALQEIHGRGKALPRTRSGIEKV